MNLEFYFFRGHQIIGGEVLEKLSSYLEKMNLNIRLPKEASEVVLEKIIYFKENKRINILLKSCEIVKNDMLKRIESEFVKKLEIFNEINIKINYELSEKHSLKDLMEKYWDNILFMINTIAPPCEALKNNFKYKMVDDAMYIEVKDPFLHKVLVDKNLAYSINRAIMEELGVKLNVFLYLEENHDKDIDEYIAEKQRESDEIVNRIVSFVETKEAEVKAEKPSGSEEENVSKVIIGKDIEEKIEYLEEVTQDSGMVALKGEIFDVTAKELKNGNLLLLLAFTDNTSSICAKIFLNQKKREKIEHRIQKGMYVKMRGTVIFDSYSRENVFDIKDMEEAVRIEKKDRSKDKRVELHAHTQMSSMDAICPAKQLIARAAKWGHKAIAITDHGVVQGFPEAMDAGNKNGIKVIYGVEGYLIDDEKPLIEYDESKGLDQEFIVFDLETTGLYYKNEEITEIGAVKVKDGKVIDTFSVLVNPEKPIPYKIQELTGITNDMVRDKETIESVLPKFLDFIEDAKYMVAHNSDFDMGFIRAKAERMGIEFDKKAIDTIDLAQVLLPEMKRFRLNNVAKKLGVSLENHHRAVDDARATANIFIKFLEMLKDKDVNSLDEIETKVGKIDYKKKRSNHITILVRTQEGVKNLYNIISKSHIDYFYKSPRIPKSLLKEYREGLIIGGACEAGEIYSSYMKNIEKEKLDKIIDFYDYVEIMPTGNNEFMVRKEIVKSIDDLRDINKTLLKLGEEHGKIVVATGDVHFIDESDSVYRRILKCSQGFSDAGDDTPLHFRSTDEMMDEFSYLGHKKAYEVVVENTNKIADLVEDGILPIPDETCPPVIEGSDEELRDMCYKKARRMYGEDLPEVVESRLERELSSIIKNGYAVMYIIAQKLVTKSLEDGYLVGSRGSVGSSLAATMSDITEVNPLPAHYRCETCLYSEFFETGSYTSGADLANKECPNCNIPLLKDGHDIPFEVFLGFEGDKEPDIDLNFAGEYQANAHKYTEVLFGKGYVYKAGTIGTIADKTAYGFAKKYLEENEIRVPTIEVERLARGCTGIKRTSGQHPGGIMVIPSYKDVHDFTPIQYPANDSSSGVITTHFDYHSISGRILKLDILGHDVPTIIRMIEDITGIDATKIPLDDKETMSIFTSTEAIGVKPEDIKCEIGSLGIPEFGTKFVRQMLLDTQPSTFGELVRISGLSHGTDVWLNNAQDLVRDGVVTLKDVISTRDDIMNYLIFKGLKPKLSFKIMEKVRKGKGLTPEDEEEMKEHDVPPWYIESCQKIKYMFPKAHAVAYVMMSFRIAYTKVHYPHSFYATYFTTKADDFDANLIVKGKEAIREKIGELSQLGNDATAKEKNLLTVLEVALEMYCRGIEISRVDIYKSDAKKFKIEDGVLIPPLIGLQGVGTNAAINVVNERDNGEFLSMEDLRMRTKISKTVIETLRDHRCLEGMPETNQLSLL